METLRFEIQSMQSRAWAVVDEFTNHADAITAFQRETMRRGVSAVRLVRVATDGAEEFQFALEEYSPRPDNAGAESDGVPPLALAPVCRSVDDLYGLEARIIMNHLLRQFLEHHSATALEGLYDVTLYNRLSHTGGVLAQAVKTAARAQLSNIDRGREPPDLPNGVRVTSSKELSDYLRGLLAENRRNGERVQALTLPSVDPMDPAAAWEACLKLGRGNLVAGKILFASAIVERIRPLSSYEEKIETLTTVFAALDEAEETLGGDLMPQLQGAVDSLIADILFQQKMREILLQGARLPRDQIVRLTGLAAGNEEVWGTLKGIQGTPIGKALKHRQMKDTAHLLVHLICKVLESRRPLVHDLVDEAPAMTTITSALMANYHQIGSIELSRALFERQMIAGDEMQRTFREMATKTLAERIKSPVLRIRFFNDLLSALEEDAAAPGAAEVLIDTLSDSPALFQDLPSLGSHGVALDFLNEAKALIPRLTQFGANQKLLNWKLDVLIGRQTLARQRA